MVLLGILFFALTYPLKYPNVFGTKILNLKFYNFHIFKIHSYYNTTVYNKLENLSAKAETL